MGALITTSLQNSNKGSPGISNRLNQSWRSPARKVFFAPATNSAILTLLHARHTPGLVRPEAHSSREAAVAGGGGRQYGAGRAAWAVLMCHRQASRGLGGPLGPGDGEAGQRSVRPGPAAPHTPPAKAEVQRGPVNRALAARTERRASLPADTATSKNRGLGRPPRAPVSAPRPEISRPAPLAACPGPARRPLRAGGPGPALPLGPSGKGARDGRTTHQSRGAARPH